MRRVLARHARSFVHYAHCIQSGTLRLDVARELMPLDSLLAFAARENPKRTFHFVSRVLGKHLPCRPSVIRASQRRLAAEVDCERGQKTLVVGLGEAATGLGAGVAEALAARVGVRDLLYMFTTRQRLGGEPLLAFDEIHSHAPEHLLFAPHERYASLFCAAEHLLLVDDEITTGRTIALLARKLAAKLPNLVRITFVSLVSWLGRAGERAVARSLPGYAVGFANLLAGTMRFEPNPDYRTSWPARVDSALGPRLAPGGNGRRGILLDDGETCPATADVPAAGPLLVLGNGEFMHQPLLLAEQLEAQGRDVLFSSTTRTPLAIGDAIHDRLEFPSQRDDPRSRVHYLYNRPSDRTIISCYERPRDARAHGLVDLVACERLVLTAAGGRPVGLAPGRAA